jgi:hypothetical protein
MMEKESLTEKELLQLKNSILEVELTQLKYATALQGRNDMIKRILLNHQFREGAKIKYPEGIIEGEKIEPKVIKNDKRSENN